jgi:hypothetical protein
MRKMIVTWAGAAALFAATAFAPPLAQAMTIAAPAGLAKAAQAANLTEDVAYVCRAGWRWRRCWWTPGYAYYRPYYYRPAYRAYAYYRPAYRAYAYRPYDYRPYAFYRPYYRPYAYYRPYYRPVFAAYGYYRGEQEWPDLDLRVDDHPDPLAELERLERVSRELFVPFRHLVPNHRDRVGLTDHAAIETEIARALAAQTSG